MEDAVQRIIDKIREDAEWKIREYNEEAEKKIEEIRRSEEEKWEEERKRIEDVGKREAEGIKSMLISRAYLEGKRKLMDAKEEIINKVIEIIKEEARKLREEYREYIKSSLIEGKSMLGEEIQVICLKEDRSIVEPIVMEICPKARIVEGHVPFGGIIVVTPDRLQKIDYSIDAFVERKRNEIRKEIAKRLFGE